MTLRGRHGVEDLAGRRFGRWTVLHFIGVTEHRAHWWCRCDCGAERDVMAQALRKGSSVSCGCYANEVRRQKGRNATHGLSKTREHSIWAGMRRRCNCPTDDAYPRYGGRGIAVCERWSSFANFIADMGPAPADHEIERVDNDGPYSPENCCWATVIEQANNKRNNRMVGDLTVAQFAKARGLKYSTAYYRTALKGLAPPRSHTRVMEQDE